MKTRMESDRARAQVYKVLSVIAVIIIAILFTFPLYWIITGAFKTGREIGAAEPQRVKVVDAEGTPEEVAQRIRSVVDELFF